MENKQVVRSSINESSKSIHDLAAEAGRSKILAAAYQHMREMDMEFGFSLSFDLSIEI